MFLIFVTRIWLKTYTGLGFYPAPPVCNFLASVHFIMEWHCVFVVPAVNFGHLRQYTPKLCEDGHSLLRCLYPQLGKFIRERVTHQTKTSSNIDRFTRRYGVKIVKLAHDNQMMCMSSTWELRLDPQVVDCLLFQWLRLHARSHQAPFGWQGFHLNDDEIFEVVTDTVHDWLQKREP